jgi:hypothetical protein
MLSYSFFILVLSHLVVLSPNLLSMNEGSSVEVYTQRGNVIRGELVQVDSSNIKIEIRLPKTSGSSKTTKFLNIDVSICDSVIIPGAFEGATPIILSALLGAGATAVSISNSDNNYYYIGGALGLLIGGFTYLFIDNTLTRESLIFTEVNKYPWKLIPYSRNYRKN